ncbi:hypothetical protein AB6A40_007986 [Gnathostoma spinigerum]|uniref:EF-hand domain-containing protein n=1 Tax=Gnathostoma spinigerum TaxID=75299 RepID=A0ABD6EXG2_9BILA
MSSGVISEVSFADLLLLYAGLPETKHRKMMKRVKKKFGGDSALKQGISIEEVEAFFCVIFFIEDVELALQYYTLANTPVDLEVLKMIAKRVVHRDIPDHVIDVVVTLFDENGDGLLSDSEFVAIMKRRMTRGLERPRSSGLVKLLELSGRCGMRQARHFTHFHHSYQ